MIHLYSSTTFRRFGYNIYTFMALIQFSKRSIEMRHFHGHAVACFFQPNVNIDFLICKTLALIIIITKNLFLLFPFDPIIRALTIVISYNLLSNLIYQSIDPSYNIIKIQSGRVEKIVFDNTFKGFSSLINSKYCNHIADCIGFVSQRQ